MERKNEFEFTHLILDHKSTIYAVCYMFSKDRDEIADLPQEIMYSLLGGMLTGVVIGGIIGLRMHNRIIGIYEGIILQLENPEAADFIMPDLVDNQR